MPQFSVRVAYSSCQDKTNSHCIPDTKQVQPFQHKLGKTLAQSRFLDSGLLLWPFIPILIWLWSSKLSWSEDDSQVFRFLGNLHVHTLNFTFSSVISHGLWNQAIMQRTCYGSSHNAFNSHNKQTNHRNNAVCATILFINFWHFALQNGWSALLKIAF